MDPLGIFLIALCVVWGAFVMYMLIHHPDTMFRWQKVALEEQKRYEAKLERAGGRAAKVAVSALNRALK